MDTTFNISKSDIITVKPVYLKKVLQLKNEHFEKKYDVTVIEMVPGYTEVKPNLIRHHTSTKEEAGFTDNKLTKDLEEGNYYLNIIDYSETELQIFCEHLTDKWITEIWELLIAEEEKSYMVALTEEAIIKRIIEKNDHLFKDRQSFDNFCSNFGIDYTFFFKPAAYPAIDIHLKVIRARLELEQFPARKYLFTSTLIEKFTWRIEEYTQNNLIPAERLLIVNRWISSLKMTIEKLKNFTDYRKIYEMKDGNKSINISNSNQVSIIDGNVENSQVSQNASSQEKKDLFGHRIKIIAIILTAIGLLITIIEKWEAISQFFTSK